MRSNSARRASARGSSLTRLPFDDAARHADGERRGSRRCQRSGAALAARRLADVDQRRPRCSSGGDRDRRATSPGHSGSQRQRRSPRQAPRRRRRRRASAGSCSDELRGVDAAAHSRGRLDRCRAGRASSVVDAPAFELRDRARADAVAQGAAGATLDVVGRDEVAPASSARRRARARTSAMRAARARAERRGRASSRVARHDAHGVVDDPLVDARRARRGRCRFTSEPRVVDALARPASSGSCVAGLARASSRTTIADFVRERSDSRSRS